ncbi:hypothetical protein D3C71_1075660 [compost metagenome]
MRLIRNALGTVVLMLWGVYLAFRSWLGQNSPNIPTGDNLVRLSDHGEPFYISGLQQWTLNGLMVLPFVALIFAMWADRKAREATKAA